VRSAFSETDDGVPVISPSESHIRTLADAMIKGIYDPMCIPCVEFRELSEDLIRTTRNRYKLIQHHCHYDLRKFNFTNRVIPVDINLSFCNWCITSVYML